MFLNVNIFFRKIKLKNVLIKHSKIGLVVKLTDFDGRDACEVNTKNRKNNFG